MSTGGGAAAIPDLSGGRTWTLHADGRDETENEMRNMEHEKLIALALGGEEDPIQVCMVYIGT
jgi:hypothetical protein